MILGYIVTDRKLTNIDGFVEQVNDISLADSTKPILIVGWKKAKQDPRYSSILEKQIGENVFWTFSKTESRSDFEDDLKNFYNIIYNNILNNISYYYINIFKLKYSNIKKLYNIILNSEENKDIYLSKNILYIPHNGRILGLSLSVLEYCGVPMSKVLDRIKSKGINIIEDNKKFIFKLSKQLGNKKYAVPYFISR
jgi:hypothetical protein